MADYFTKFSLIIELPDQAAQTRTDGYGGGAVIITARKIKSINTGQWLHQHAA